MKVLQDAQVTWVQDEDNNNWVVRTADAEELFQLPGRLTDKEAMAILHAARKYELAAYASGQADGLGAMKVVMTNKLVEMETRFKTSLDENARLADLLEMSL